MGLETTFYIIGIVAMSLWIIIAITCLILVFYVRYQVKAFQSSFAGRIASMLRNRKAELFTTLGITIAQTLVNRFRKKSPDTSEA